jgi:RimJ/RimL family protein N-acetyltransferase
MISVRRIQISEGELFKRMRLTALCESPSVFASTYEAALRRSPESWSKQANSTAQGSDRSTFIAFSDDSPIGIAALYRTEEENDVGELLQMWVSPEYRGKGVAHGLMAAVFQWASANGFRTVVATITKGNVRALRFYQNCGFKLESEASLNGADDLVKGGRPCFLRCRAPVMPVVGRMPARSVSDGSIAGFQ